ncbi:hypothetical protein KY284_000864 [Solanum tuberosum]|nr:hypothetical protein KY284_000864 [Solanum tuberosum]
MEEVIIKEEQKEGIITLFPRLQKLSLRNLPKLGHFFMTNNALEFPFLRSVDIYDCPEMKMFIQQEISVSTPILESVNFPFNYEVKVDDMNKWTQQRFNYKEQNASNATYSWQNL